jgi:hypothetical protein
LRAANATTYDFGEPELNSLGYQLVAVELDATNLHAAEMLKKLR